MVQAYAFGKYLGYLKVEFDEKGNVVTSHGNPILLNSSIPEGMWNSGQWSTNPKIRWLDCVLFALLTFQDNVSEELSFFLEFTLLSSWIRFKTHPNFRSPHGLLQALSAPDAVTLLIVRFSALPWHRRTTLSSCPRGELGESWVQIGKDCWSGALESQSFWQPEGGARTPQQDLSSLHLPKYKHNHCPHLHHGCYPWWASR